MVFFGRKEELAAEAGDNIVDIYKGFEETGLGNDMAPGFSDQLAKEFHSKAAVNYRESQQKKFGFRADN